MPIDSAPVSHSSDRLAPPGRLSAAWLAEQARAAAAAWLLVFGGGLLRAAWRRQLGGGAILAGVATCMLGALAAAYGAEALFPAVAWRETNWPFAIGLLLAWLVGFVVTGRSQGKLAAFELQAVWLLLAGLAAALLSRPWGHWWGQQSVPWAPTLGEVLLGPLWDRLLGLFLAAGGLLGLWGASTALALGIGVSARATARPTWLLEGFLVARSLLYSRAGAATATARVATLGVALGVAALIVVTAVMSGYQGEIEGRILQTNAHMVVQKYGADFVEAEALLQKVQAIPGVAAAAPFAFNEALLAASNKSFTVLLKGMADTATPVTDLASQLCQSLAGSGQTARCGPKAPGEPPPLSWQGGEGGRPVYVGLALFRALNVPLGSSVQLMAPASLDASGRRSPRRERFVLAGVFQSGMHEFDSHLVYLALPDAQALLGLGDAVSGIEMRLTDPFAVGQVSRQVLSTLGHYPYRTLDWRALNASIFTALSLQKVVMFLLLSFIVVVASFNIASTLLMAVMQRSGQVAVLKSMGAKDVTVLRLFVFEGLAIGLAGCGLGLLLGLGCAAGLSLLKLDIAADVYMVSRLAVRLDWREVATTLGVAFAICQIASTVPALRAAKLSPQQLFDEAT